MKALIVIGQSEYDYHSALAMTAATRLESLGYETTYVNTSLSEDSNLLKYAMNEANPDFLVTFDCAGFNLDLLGGDLFYNSLACPAAHILCKRPYMYNEQLQQRVNFVMEYYCLSEEDTLYVQKKYNRVPKIHAVAAETLSDIATGDRPLELLLPCTYVDPLAIMNLISKMDMPQKELNIYLIDRARQEHTFDLYGYVKDYIIDKGIEINSLNEILASTDAASAYIRAEKIEEITQNFVRDQIPFAVCGRGWKQRCDNLDIVTVIGENGISSQQYPQLLAQTQVIIDPHPHRPDAVTLNSIFAGQAGTKIIDENTTDNSRLYSNIAKILG